MADTLSGAGLTDGTVTEAKLAAVLSAKVSGAYNQANNAYARANTSLSTAGDTTITGNMFFASGSKLGIGILTPNTALHVNGTMTVSETIEKINVSATSMGTSLNFDIQTQPILYLTSDATANCTLNFRASSTTPINDFLATGQSITSTMMVTNGSIAYYINAVQVDSITQSVKWAGGTAPSSGNPSSVDVYSFTIIKTAPLTFTVLGSQQKYT